MIVFLFLTANSSLLISAQYRSSEKLGGNKKKKKEWIYFRSTILSFGDYLFGEQNWILTLLGLCSRWTQEKNLDAICFRFLLSQPLLCFMALCSSDYFVKIKILGRFRLYNISSISEHVTKDLAFLYWVIQDDDRYCLKLIVISNYMNGSFMHL